MKAPAGDAGLMLPAWRADPAVREGYVVGVLPGEGIGPEVISATLEVLSAVTDATGVRVGVRSGGEIGLTARRLHGSDLTADVASFCEEVFAAGGALLCGPGGGRFVYDLRAKFDLYCKLVPIRPLAALADAGPLRVPLGTTDVLVVRENVGGAYFGAGSVVRRGSRATEADHHFRYEASQVDRVLDAAVELAVRRSRHLTVVVKPAGIPAISELWTERARAATAGREVELELLEIDNACYQVVAESARFDVIAAPNLFGDVVGDTAALLLGSRGNSHSGNFGRGGRAVYQTAHGAAHDLAGRDLANPIGQIRSLSMLLRESFELPEQAAAIDRAVERVVAEGWRTPDIAAPGCMAIGTRELGQRIAEATRDELDRAG